MSPHLRRGRAAVAFLTRIPVRRAGEFDGDDVRRSGPYFPLIGAAVGGASGALAERLPQPLGAAVGVTCQAAITGALHLDALADTADATGARTPERTLAIMRDSSVGAFGVTALTCDLIVKTAAVAALAEHHRATRAGFAAGALSRAAPVGLAAALPYARDSTGIGEAMTRTSAQDAIAAALVAAVVTMAALDADSIVLGSAALGFATWLGRRYRRWLGGVTGDMLGAASEMTETLVLVIAVVLEARS